MAAKKSQVDLSCSIGNVKFKNPFFVSSGPTTKHVEQLVKAEELGWAAASIKLTFDPMPYISLPPRYGYWSRERFLSFSAETRLDVEEGLELMRQARKQTKELVLFANMSYAGDAGLPGWINMAKRFEDAGSHIIELNMCCPNMSFNVAKSGKLGAMHRTGASMGEDAETTAAVTAAVVKAVKIPVIVKITPEGGRIGAVAKAAFEAGAQGVTSVANRLAVPPIDVENPTKSIYHLQEQPSMSCMSGPWIKPLALRDVYEIRKSVGPDRMILGTGGAMTMSDVVEFMMCGADMVGFCTGILLEGYELLPPLQKDLLEYMKRHGYTHPREFRDVVAKSITANDKLTIYEGHAQKKENCLVAPCVSACPAHVPGHAYVQFVARGEYQRAYEEIIAKNPFQNVCGHVCNHPCETECVRGQLEEPIRIRDIKRFVLDMARAEGWKPTAIKGASRPEKVAVIGSGPAGLSCAHDLARAGYKVTVFERDAEPGGMLRWALPTFRLPKDVLAEGIDQVLALGVEIKTGVELNEHVTLKELKLEGFKAVFLGVGAQKGTKLGIEPEGVEGCMTALELLRKAFDGINPVLGKRVAVIGGGFTAVDAARIAIRLGATEVFILYRRTRSEMPAVTEEVDEAEEEGVKVMYLVSPKSVLTREGKVVGLEMVNHVLAEVDKSGRRRPEAVAETEFKLKADVIVSALGQEVDLNAKSGVKLTANGTIAADEMSGSCGKGVFAGGDAVTGANNLISAIAAGKRAAASIDKFLAGDDATLAIEPDAVAVKPEIVLARAGNQPRQGRVPLPMRAPKERKKDFNAYTSTMTEAEAKAEAARCLNCGCGVACGLCYRVCMSLAISLKNGHYEIDKEKCKACGMCFRRCPNMNVEMVQTAK